MFYVYVLQSLKDYRTYVGFSDDWKRRLTQHNAGQVKSTKDRRPLKILFIETFEKRTEAMKRELWWKSAAGRRKLKEKFKQSHEFNH